MRLCCAGVNPSYMIQNVYEVVTIWSDDYEYSRERVSLERLLDVEEMPSAFGYIEPLTPLCAFVEDAYCVDWLPFGCPFQRDAESVYKRMLGINDDLPF